MRKQTEFIPGDLAAQLKIRAKIEAAEKWFETLRACDEWHTTEQKWGVLEMQAGDIRKLYAELEALTGKEAK